MSGFFKLALPGYNALTDTNPDHFSIYTNGTSDHVLIKEKTRGSVSFNYHDYPTGYPIAHNLGYVPFFLAFVKDPTGYIFTGSKDCWFQIGNANLHIAYGAWSTTSNLVLGDGTGETTTYLYYIFYDNQVGSSGQSVSLADNVMAITKLGKNILISTDPNDFIYRTDLNTFKIIKEGVETINYTGSGVYSFNHGASISNSASFMTFIKFADGSITMGNGTFVAQDRSFLVSIQSGINSSQIKNRIGSSGSGTLYVKYYIFETPLAGSAGVSITLNDHKARFAKPTYNALTDTDSNHYYFLSGFNTLKYHLSNNVNLNGSWTTNPGDSVKTFTTSISHDLGYKPFFICYIDFGSGYNIIPYIYSVMTVGTEIASAWVDNNKIYFDVQLRPGIYSNTWNYNFTFYYKIFKNNLNL